MHIEISSPTAKWQIGGVMTPVLSQASTEYVRVPVFAASGGVPVDPTAGSVSMAFVQAYGAPEDAAWQSASWDTTEIGTYVAQCLIGPSGATALTVGTYYVWLKIAATPETVIECAGEVRVV
jgi:hypothetical protein